MEYLHYFLFALGGALAVSLAEYIFNYNLIDLLKDKVLGLFGPKPIK
jgi:hypothetical protein